jgi:hypothetical protein
MGLLDEAIRDHLELKRRQGADPDEIALKEREALEPVIPDEPATWGADPSFMLEDVIDEPSQSSPVEAESEGAEDTSVVGRAIDFSTVGQETAEIDMREVLGVDPHASEEHYASVPDDIEAEGAQDLDLAVGATQEPAQEIPGQERLSFE